MTRGRSHRREIEAEVTHIVGGTQAGSGDVRVLRSDQGRLVEVRAPAIRLVQRQVGESDKHGDPITEHTPDWARLAQERIADSIKMERPRFSGHDIEGHVRIGGRRYSAFTSGGADDFVIVVRDYPSASPQG